MGILKAPGLDGCHPSFFNSQWDTLSFFIYRFILSTRTHLEHIVDINQNLLTLVPKSSNHSSLTKFSPISLCNVIYKIVAKI